MSFLKISFIYIAIIILGIVFIPRLESKYFTVAKNSVPIKSWTVAVALPNKRNLNSNNLQIDNSQTVQDLNNSIQSLPVFHPEDQFCPLDNPNNSVHLKIY